ncbi:MAG: RES family NAD+ phosphorylase [Acidimicrobiia bacterium]
MATLYRVFPWLPDARRGHPGHPSFVPGGGAGRIDNPEHYLALYLSDGPGGACAEAFFFKTVWDAKMLRGSPSLTGSVQAIATFELDPGTQICDLDDASRLVALGLRPSHVVTRDRNVTQAWALSIFQQQNFGGIRWWSYHDPRWGSHGVWATSNLELQGVEALTLGHAAVSEAAAVLNRRIA